jgi:hypothetical protein
MEILGGGTGISIFIIINAVAIGYGGFPLHLHYHLVASTGGNVKTIIYTNINLNIALIKMRLYGKKKNEMYSTAQTMQTRII